MVGVKEICALLLAGSMGAGSVVAVQQAKSPLAKQRAAKPARHKVSAPARPAPSPLNDCPSFAATLGGSPGPLAPLAVMETAELGLLTPMTDLGVPPQGGGGFILPPGGGGGGGTAFPPAPPVPVPTGGVPQPAAWAMMVSGFGLVGLSLRRSPAPASRDA